MQPSGFRMQARHTRLPVVPFAGLRSSRFLRCCSLTVVFKYVDNIATLYAHVLSMLIIVLFSWLLFDLHLSLALLCGFATCILSLWL